MTTSFKEDSKLKSILKSQHFLTYPVGNRDSLTTTSYTLLDSQFSDDLKSLDSYVNRNNTNDKFHHFVDSMNEKDALKTIVSSNSSIISYSYNRAHPVKSVRFASDNNLVRVKTYDTLDQPCIISSNQIASSKNDVYKNKYNGSKEFFGNNVKYCLREYYIDEQNKKRSIKMKKLQMKNNKEFLRLRQKSIESDKDFINENSDIYKLLKRKVDSEENDATKQNLAIGTDTEDYNGLTESDEESDEFEDEGLNFKNLSKLTISDTNFSNLKQWETPSTNGNAANKNLFDLKKLNISYYSKNRHQSLTNLKHFDTSPDPNLSRDIEKFVSSSLDNINSLNKSKESVGDVSLSPLSKNLSHHTIILDSNFNYQQNLMHQYPWQFNSKTIQVKNVYVSQSQNQLIVYLSVENLAFEKDIKLKYSFDNWNKIFYSEGKYEKQINSKYDEFKCVIDIPLSSNNKETITEINFCCSYKVNNMVYYDNNNYHNFKLKLKTTKKINYQSETSSQTSSNVNKNLVKPPNTPEKVDLTRSFEQSKLFYNTSPWKNIYRQDSVTKIFDGVKNECSKITGGHEQGNFQDGISESKPIISAIPIIRRQSNSDDFNLWKSELKDGNYVVQNFSDCTSDSLLTSDDYDIGRLSPNNNKNLLKLGGSFELENVSSPTKQDNFKSSFGNYNTISKNISFDEFNKSVEPRMNLPDIKEFINDEKNDEVYANLIKNYCFFKSGNETKVEDESNPNQRLNKTDEYSKSSSCTIKAPIKAVDGLTISSLNVNCVTSRPSS
ncbi:hypothetical protein ACO0OL_003899 [Hanseniaspora opuntiae]